MSNVMSGGEIQAFEELSGSVIIDMSSSQVRQRIKKREEISSFALSALTNLSEEKITFVLSSKDANLFSIIQAKAGKNLGIPYGNMGIELSCCPQCIGKLETELCFDRSILCKSPCGRTHFSKGDLCPFCGSLFVGFFCESITDFLANYGYNRRFTRKKPLVMLKRTSNKFNFYYWRMNQFPYIIIGDAFSKFDGVIKSSV